MVIRNSPGRVARGPSPISHNCLCAPLSLSYSANPILWSVPLPRPVAWPVYYAPVELPLWEWIYSTICIVYIYTIFFKCMFYTLNYGAWKIFARVDISLVVGYTLYYTQKPNECNSCGRHPLKPKPKPYVSEAKRSNQTKTMVWRRHQAAQSTASAME